MTFIGCSGFAVPASKYLKEFQMVEIAETTLGVPGPALVRRWIREAPPGFIFHAVAPKDWVLDGFEPSPTAPGLWDTFLPVARELRAENIVLLSPPESPWSKKSKSLATHALESACKIADRPIVWEPPAGWPLKESEAIAKPLGIVVARDPTQHPPFQKRALAYYRLCGPAGYKSRYEDASIEAAAKTLKETNAEQTYVIFANVDMYSDAKRLRAL
jgi:uncharacterized protein YecE (DUF72 family)